MALNAPHGTGAVRWVTTGWLAENLDSEPMVVLDTQPNIHDYISGHVKGARYFNEGLLRAELGGLPGNYAPREGIEAAFRRLGLEPRLPVVVTTGKGPYKGWGDGLEAAMVAYSLARFGHERVLVLDGGLEKWAQEGHPLVKEFPSHSDSAFAAGARSGYAIGYDEVRTRKDDGETVLLDARPPEVYAGQGPWQKPGHIPGAVNLPWKTLVDDDNPRLLRDAGEMRARFEAAGATPDRPVICSCGTGREATLEFLLLKWFFEYPRVWIYEGSFTEWSAVPDNPTVTGPEPRG